MPSRNDGLSVGKYLLGQNVSKALAHGSNTYHNAAKAAKESRRLKEDEAHAERLVRDYFKGHTGRPESEELIKRGVALEEAGRLIEACKLYEKVLASEPGNLELRQYVGGLVTQINMRISEDSRRARAEATMGPGVSGRPGRSSSSNRPGTAPSASLFSGGDGGRIRGGSSGNRADGGVATAVSNNSLIYRMRSGAHENNPSYRSTSGMPLPMSKELYKAELQQQVEDMHQRKARAQAEEALLERKQVEAAEIRHRIEKYNAHVSDGNDQMALKQKIARHRQEQKERRMQSFNAERLERASTVPGGIYAGDGERMWIEEKRDQRGVPATGGSSLGVHNSKKPLPQSTAFHTGSGPREAKIQQRVSSHAMSDEERLRQLRYPGVKPRSAQPRSTQAVFEPPFMRPGVDAPVIKTQLADVADRGAAWAAKREKPVSKAADHLNPQNHVRPGDGMPFMADRVEQQLQKAAAQAAKNAAAVEKKKGRDYYY